MIPIYRPYLPKHSLEYAKDAIDSTWISSQGKYLDDAKSLLESMLGGRYVQLVNNGTSAVHLMAKALNYRYPHINRILVPNSVYVAAWNGFLYDGKYELVPIECDIDTWNMDITKIGEHLDGNTALLVVHNLGNIVNVPQIKRAHPDLVILEDACEGIFGEYEGRPVGTESFVSAFSFFGNKTVTSGEGGAVVTNDIDAYEYIHNIQGQGQGDKRYIHKNLGYNYRMTNIQAAILYGQLLIANDINHKKEMIFDYYRTELNQIDGVWTQTIEAPTHHSNWMMGVRIEGLDSFDTISKYMSGKGIDVRPMFYPMSYHDYDICDNIGDESISVLLSNECFMIPSFPELTDIELK